MTEQWPSDDRTMTEWISIGCHISVMPVLVQPLLSRFFLNCTPGFYHFDQFLKFRICPLTLKTWERSCFHTRKQDGSRIQKSTCVFAYIQFICVKTKKTQGNNNTWNGKFLKHTQEFLCSIQKWQYNWKHDHTRDNTEQTSKGIYMYKEKLQYIKLKFQKRKRSYCLKKIETIV